MPLDRDSALKAALDANREAVIDWLQSRSGIDRSRIGADALATRPPGPWLSLELQDLRIVQRPLANEDRSAVDLKAELVHRCFAHEEPPGQRGYLLAELALAAELAGSPQCRVQPATAEASLTLDIAWVTELRAPLVPAPPVLRVVNEVARKDALQGFVVGPKGPLFGAVVRLGGDSVTATANDGSFRIELRRIPGPQAVLEVQHRGAAHRFALNTLPRDERGVRVLIAEEE